MRGGFAAPDIEVDMQRAVPTLAGVFFYASSALAQVAPLPAPVATPSLGDRLGGWLPFILILLFAIGVYQYRKRRGLR